MMPYHIPSFRAGARMLCGKMRNGSVSRSEESIIRMTINVSLIMTADFARLGTFYHSPFIFRGNAIKKNRSESVPDGHKSNGIQVFQNFSKNTLENFHIRIRYALVETSVQGDGFFAADFFHFFCPVGEEEAVFPCIFFYPLFAYEALFNHGPYHDGDRGVGQVEVVFQYLLGDHFFLCVDR